MCVCVENIVFDASITLIVVLFQMQTSWMSEGVLAAEQPAVTFPLPPNGQAIQVQQLLQMFCGRALPSGAHTQAQGVKTPEDAHLPILRQELYAGNVSQQAHAETCRKDGQAAAYRTRSR